MSSPTCSGCCASRGSSIVPARDHRCFEGQPRGWRINLSPRVRPLSLRAETISSRCCSTGILLWVNKGVEISDMNCGVRPEPGICQGPPRALTTSHAPGSTCLHKPSVVASNESELTSISYPMILAFRLLARKVDSCQSSCQARMWDNILYSQRKAELYRLLPLNTPLPPYRLAIPCDFNVLNSLLGWHESWHEIPRHDSAR